MFSFYSFFTHRMLLLRHQRTRLGRILSLKLAKVRLARTHFPVCFHYMHFKDLSKGRSTLVHDLRGVATHTYGYYDLVIEILLHGRDCLFLILIHAFNEFQERLEINLCTSHPGNCIPILKKIKENKVKSIVGPLSFFTEIFKTLL